MVMNNHLGSECLFIQGFILSTKLIQKKHKDNFRIFSGQSTIGLTAICSFFTNKGEWVNS